MIPQNTMWMADRCALSISIEALAVPSSTTAHNADSSPRIESATSTPSVTTTPRKTLNALFEAARLEVRAFVTREHHVNVQWLEAA